MKLGDIEERRSLNPRDHLSHGRVQEYVRRLQNGDVPPPLVIHAAKRVLFAGALRFQAWKAYLGDAWEKYEVDVILRDDLPDPDEQPALFRLMAAADNRDHGQPMTRFERRSVAAELAVQAGIDAAVTYAKSLNETDDSLRQLLGTLNRWAGAITEAVERQASEDGVTEPVAIDSPHLVPISRAVAYPPGSFPTGYLRGHVPAIRHACRQLRAALAEHSGDLDEADRAELEQTLEAIQSLLGVMAEAV